MQLVLFASLAWWVRKHPVDSFDVKVTRALQKKQLPFLQYVSLFLSFICSWQLFNILALPLAFAFWKARLRLEAVMFVSVTVMCTVFRRVLQRSISRPRPSPMLVHVTKQKKGKSFPSGHAATSLACWGWLLVLGNLFIKGKRLWQKAILSIPALFIALAGPSRIYLGEHWTSDVIGGYLYGGAWLSLSFQLYLTLKEKDVLAHKQ